MPVLNRKRRAPAYPELEPTPSRRQPSSAEDEDLVDDPEAAGDEYMEGNGPDENRDGINQMVKNLVRMALACEYSRTPIRRTDIIAKVLPSGSSRQFKQVFAEANTQLQSVFGMELTPLPQRERATISQKRAAMSRAQNSSRATQRRRDGNNDNEDTTQDISTQNPAANTQQASSSNPNQSYILTSTLPARYRIPSVLPPAHIPTPAREGSYTGLVSFILALIYLSPGQTVSEARLSKQLKRVNADEYAGTNGERTDALLKRMLKEGYLARIRDSATVTDGNANGAAEEETVEYVVGPRGKVEVGEKGVAGLVRTVFHFHHQQQRQQQQGRQGDDGAEVVRTGIGGPADEMDIDELERRLVRSLGDSVEDKDRKQEREREREQRAQQTQQTQTQEESTHDQGTRGNEARATRRSARHGGTAPAEDEMEEDNDGEDDDEG